MLLRRLVCSCMRVRGLLRSSASSAPRRPRVLIVIPRPHRDRVLRPIRQRVPLRGIGRVTVAPPPPGGPPPGYGSPPPAPSSDPSPCAARTGVSVKLQCFKCIYHHEEFVFTQ